MRNAVCSSFKNFPPCGVACGAAGGFLNMLQFIYSRIKQRASFNVGLAFLFLTLFNSNTFATIISVSASGSWHHSHCPADGYVRCHYNIYESLIEVCTQNDNCQTYSLSLGQSASFVGGFVTGGWSGSCVTVSLAGPWSTVSGEGNYDRDHPCDAGCQWRQSCFANFQITPDGDLSPPACANPHLTSAPECKGGQGLFMRGSEMIVANTISFMYGNDGWRESTGNGSYHYFWNGGLQTAYISVSPPGAEADPSTRPDGSQCNNFNQGSGLIVDALICPLGFEDEPPSSSSAELLSSSSAANDLSSSGANVSSSGANDGSSGSGVSSSGACHIMINGVCADRPDSGCSIMVNGVCMDKPEGDNCAIMLNGVCIQYKSSSGGGNGEGGDGEGGGGLGCKNLNGCDWAKVTVQLRQLGVSEEVLRKLGDLAGLASSGYNLTEEQIRQMADVLKHLNASDIDTKAWRGRLDSLLFGKGGDGVPGGGGFPGGTCDPRVGDCSQDFDVSEVDGFGIGRYGIDSALSRFGADSGSVRAGYSMTRLLADTSKVFPHMRRAVSPFNDYIRKQSNDCKTQLDFSFTMGGFSCIENCKIDLNNFGGKPIGKMMTDIFTIAFGLGICIRLLYVVRTIGQKG